MGVGLGLLGWPGGGPGVAWDDFTIRELSGNYPGTIRDFGGWPAGLWGLCWGGAGGGPGGGSGGGLGRWGVAGEVAWVIQIKSKQI